jgi:hypothetical protein
VTPALQINCRVNIKNNIPYRVTSECVMWWRGRYARGFRYAVRTLGDASAYILLYSIAQGLVAVAG